MSAIELRTVKEAEYIILTKKTIRQTAEYFNVSKSTVHNDLKNRLPRINLKLFKKVQKILKIHFDEKHLKGGEATKQKFTLKKQKKNII